MKRCTCVLWVVGAVLGMSVLGVPASLVVAVSSDYAACTAADPLVFEGLIKLNEEMQAVPALAKAWEFSSDGLVWIFHLRYDAVFHDGSPVSALEVVSALSGRTYGSPYDTAAQNEMIEAFAIDDYTVMVNLPSANAFFLEALATVPIRPEGTDEIIGTGPYVVEEWAPYKYLLLRSFEEYWDGDTRAAFDEVCFLVFADSAVRFLRVEAGDADLMLDASSEQYFQASDVSGIEAHSFPSVSYVSLDFNLNTDFFADTQVRNAIASAINRDALLDWVYQGSASLCTSPIHPRYLGGYELEPGYEYSRDNAKQLLAQAGYGESIEFSILVPETHRDLMDAAMLIQQNLVDIGIRAYLHPLDFASYYNRLYSGDFEATLGYTYSGFPFPYLNRWMSDSPVNLTGYSDPYVDMLITELQVTYDLDLRNEIYREIASVLAEQLPSVSLLYPHQIIVARAGLHIVGDTPWFVSIDDSGARITLNASGDYMFKTKDGGNCWGL